MDNNNMLKNQQDTYNIRVEVLFPMVDTYAHAKVKVREINSTTSTYMELHGAWVFDVYKHMKKDMILTLCKPSIVHDTSSNGLTDSYRFDIYDAAMLVLPHDADNNVVKSKRVISNDSITLSKRQKANTPLKLSISNGGRKATAPVLYTQLKELKPSDKVNIWGVVSDFRAPQSTRGTDMVMILQLVDESTGYERHSSLKCVLFRKCVQELPIVRAIGDIVRLHRLSICLYIGNNQGKCFNGFSAVTFTGRVGDSLEPRSSEDGFKHTVSTSDHQRVKELRKWWNFRQGGISDVVDDERKSSKRPLLRLDEVSQPLFFDVIVDVLGSGLSEVPASFVDLTVSDGSLPQPSHITIWEEHSVTAATLCPGDRVLLSNVRAQSFEGKFRFSLSSGPYGSIKMISKASISTTKMATIEELRILGKYKISMTLVGFSVSETDDGLLINLRLQDASERWLDTIVYDNDVLDLFSGNIGAKEARIRLGNALDKPLDCCIISYTSSEGLPRFRIFNTRL